MQETNLYSGVELRSLIPSFVRHLRAENKSANTIDSYQEAVKQFYRFAAESGMPRIASSITREHVETWVMELLNRKSAATANNRYRGLRQFFKWAVDEGEIKSTPMLNMKPPTVPEVVVPVLTEFQLEALIKACSGKSFTDRRDMALVQMFMSTGARKSEVANMRWSDDSPEDSDIDLDAGVAMFRGKGNKQRLSGVSPMATVAVDRYLRSRRAHRAANSPYLWLGKHGRLLPDGCARAVQKRAQLAGVGHIYVHQVRHSFAHYWLLDGGTEESLMRTMGWKSREMVSRYAASASSERAIIASRSVGLGARF